MYILFSNESAQRREQMGQVKALGIDEMVSIWQSAYDNAWHLDK